MAINQDHLYLRYLKQHEEQFDFVDYHTKNLKADRITIPVESWLNLNSAHGFIDDNMPTYDLIFVDELESLLTQFSSEETFNDRSRNT